MKPVRGRGRFGNSLRMQQRGRVRQLTDARQILKMKRGRQNRGGQANRQNVSRLLVRSQTNRSSWRKQQSNVRRQGGRIVRKKSQFDLNDSSGKRVLLQKGGRIIVTSKQIEGTLDDELDIEDKQIIADGGDITVTKVNYGQLGKGRNIFEHLSQMKKGALSMEVDDDDLEKLTLEDLPETRKTARFKSSVPMLAEPSVSLLSWPSQHSQSTQVISRLQKHPQLTQPLSATSQGDYSILVTNLHGEVTKEDVVELFSDVGTVTGAQLVQPGTALVTYSNKEEASWACDIYHNRLLDGQPMQCTLLSTASTTKPAGRITDRLSPIVPTVTRRSSIPASISQSSTLAPPTRSAAVVDSSAGRAVNFTVRVP